MSVFRHGDDSVVSGTRTQQKEVKEQWSEHLLVKHLATLTMHSAGRRHRGQGAEQDCEMGQTSIRIGT